MLQAIFLLVALGTIVLMIHKRRPLYQAMLAGIALLVISMGKPPAESAALLFQGLTSEATLELVFAVGLISLLSQMLKDFGFLEKLMSSMVAFFRSAKIAVVLAPALIGLFPVVGGAIISAPLVDSLGDRVHLSQTMKTTVNLVFRHAVFFFSPFNPALILMAGITGIELLTLLKYLFPIGAVNIAVGYFWYLHRREETRFALDDADQGSWLKKSGALLYYGAPLMASLGLFVVFGVPLLLSLLAGVLTALVLGEKSGVDFKNLLLKGPDPLLMVGIAGIMVFQKLVVDLEGAFVLINAVVESGVPREAVFILVPMLVGWVSAAFNIAIGVSLPLLFPLVQGDGGSIFYAVLLYTSAFFSYFVSPIHMCQVLSNNYFCVHTFEAHKTQYPVLAATFLSGLLLFGIGVAVL